MFGHHRPDWEAWRNDDRGYIYFTRFRDVAGQTFIKIGRTIQPLSARMYSVAYDAFKYRRVLFIDWESIGIVPGTGRDELAAQSRFRKHVIEVVRSNGSIGRTEFFEDVPSISKYASRVCSIAPDEYRFPDRRFLIWRDGIISRAGDRASSYAWEDHPVEGRFQNLLPLGLASII